MDRVVALLVAYDGTDFNGWQTQHDLRTVQLVLEQAIRRVVRHQVNLVGSGRTDSGVHAAGQMCHFLTTSSMEPGKLRHAIGSRLPKDVSVIAAFDANPSFDARKLALSKLYRYRIHASPGRPVEHMRQCYAYHFWQPLRMEAMESAAGRFVGEKDFAAMAAAGSERESTVRTVIRCEVRRHLDEICIDVEGTGFLYKQVRNMVGTLIAIAKGQWPPDAIPQILATRDRANAGPTAPARGLCLQWVRYPPALLQPEHERQRHQAHL